jgi:predicted NBD/HSP70 family sugar kinase
VDFAGTLLEKDIRAIDEADVESPFTVLGFSELRGIIASLIEKRGKEKCMGIGIGITGLVNSVAQTIVFCPNIRGYNNLAISSVLGKQFKVPVAVDTSARCMALGEIYFGGHGNIGDFSFISAAYSVSAGTVIDGKIFRGANGFAGELGHVKAIMGDQKVCTCGSYNCIEGYVTLPEIKTMLIKKLKSFNGFSGLKDKFEQSGKITYADIANAASLGDKIAVESLGEVIEKFSIVLADYINLFNPATLVLGGGFFDLFPFVLPELERELQKQCLTPSFRNMEMRLSELSVDGAIRGAAMQIIQTVF